MWWRWDGVGASRVSAEYAAHVGVRASFSNSVPMVGRSRFY